MKNFKKLASAIAALSLAACVAVPMSATVFTASAVNVTIDQPESDKGTHTYVAYQVFTGKIDTVGGDKILTGIEWGTGINPTPAEKDSLLDALKSIKITKDESDFYPFTDDNKSTGGALASAAAVAKALGDNSTDNDLADQFAAVVEEYATGTAIGGTTSGNTVGITDPGYYLIKDKESPALGTTNSGAKTRFLLKIVDPTESSVTVKAKASAPTVDKQVFDLTDSTDANDNQDGTTGATNDGWGETADHAIGEKFNFKLKAKLPNEDEIDKYESYKLIFNDSWSDGVDYIGDAVTLKVNDEEITLTGADFTQSSTEAINGVSWVVDKVNKKLTITIEDVRDILPSSVTSLKGVSVEIVYNAKLNEKADVENLKNTNSENLNKVSLDYSNNPNASGSGTWEHGSTPDDSVWVFTYEVDNTKVDENSQPLAGAGFTLYDSTGSSIVPLYKGTDGFYYPYDATINGSSVTPLNTVNQIITAAEDSGNVFKFKGLDAGTYVLKETQTPSGYNTCNDITIEIEATHAENNPGTEVKNVATFSKSTGMNNTIENKKGATLPSTGGIGTTLFYLGGGALMAVVGVMLITKKRMTKE